MPRENERRGHATISKPVVVGLVPRCATTTRRATSLAANLKNDRPIEKWRGRGELLGDLRKFDAEMEDWLMEAFGAEVKERGDR